MVGHGEVAHPDAHAVVQAYVQRVDGREHPTVPAPDVEVGHGVDLGRLAAGLHVKRVEQETEVAVHLADVRVFGLGVGHPHAHHAHGHLHHLIGVRVVHEGAWASSLELIDIGLAHGDGALIQAAYAVHAAGQALAVPVDGGVLRQLVGHEDAHAVALDHLDGGAWALAVVTPHVDLEARRYLPHHRLGYQVELLDAIVHAPGQGPAIERDHRVIGPAGLGHQRRRGIDRSLDHRLRQASQS